MLFHMYSALTLNPTERYCFCVWEATNSTLFLELNCLMLICHCHWLKQSSLIKLNYTAEKILTKRFQFLLAIYTCLQITLFLSVFSL